MFSLTIRISFIILFTVVKQSIALSQSADKIFDFLNRNQLDSAYREGRRIISNEPANSEAYWGLGRATMRRGDISEATGYLEKALTLSGAPLFARAWTHYDLALCNYNIGNYELANRHLQSSIEMNATNNAVAAAKMYYNRLGFSTHFTGWQSMRTEHFIFHYQDPGKINVKDFMERRENAFVKLNDFFKANLPKKIDYFVWADASSADSIVKQPLAFTDAFLCVTHTDPRHTVGHEIVHSLSYYSVKSDFKSKLIAEGVCVYLDLSARNNIADLKNLHTPISIKSIWKDPRRVDDAIIYPLGGELVKQLIEKHGRDKFMRLLINQSYESAREIYSDDLEDIIKGIESEIN